MSRPTILVSETLSQRALDWLAQRAEVLRCGPEDCIEHIHKADALIVRTYTQVRDELLERVEKLKVVGRAGVAIENIDVPACRAKGIEVVHTPAANTWAVVDYTIAAILNMNRKFWPLENRVTTEEFHKIRKQAYGRFLSDLTLGIVGCGRIGSRVGRAAAGLGMKVLYNDILDIKVDYPAQAVDKDTLYANSDIVTIHVPQTELTIKMINAGTLAKFKDGAQFINAARGKCVDYNDLAQAVKTGKVSAATIDCHDPEPPTEDYPLWDLDNVTMTPHSAARVPQAMENMCDVIYDIMAVLEGKTPQYPAVIE